MFGDNPVFGERPRRGPAPGSVSLDVDVAEGLVMAVGSCLMDAPRSREPREARRPTAPSPLGRARRWSRKALRSALLVYGGLLAVLFALQARMIFPGSETQGKPSSVVQPPRDAELVSLQTARGDRVVAFFGPALTPQGKPRPDAAKCPTILFFYGNAMNLSESLDDFRFFRTLGVNVMIPEYVGYGMSGGQAGETGCQATADAAYSHLLTRKDIDPTRIIVAGWSLGGAVAIDLA